LSESKLKFSKKLIVHDSLYEEAMQLGGLKRYLNEYTLISQREAIEVELFEEYLIYAQIFGIADKVAKDFKKLYPNIIENSNYNFSDVISVNSFATIVFKVLLNPNNSRSSSRMRAGRSSSSGNGRSFGGGGRGSFGGGRGGGGGR
jgi:uncharacterized membrane protein